MAVRFEAGASESTVGRLQRTPAFTGTPYTVVAWFRFDDDSVPTTIAFDFYRTDWSVDNWLELRPSNVLRASTGVYVDSASDAWQDATWHCMAMTRSATSQTGYVLDRGVVISRSTAASADFQVEALLGYDGDDSASGRAVTHYKCWTADLTHEELAREMQQFAPVRTADLVAYAKLEAHTDLSDEIAGSFSAVNVTPSTVAGPSGVQDEWTGPRVASSATTAATSSSGGLSCNMPSGIEAGDLLLAQAANDTSVSWSASAGWTSIDNGANGSAVQGATWARIATGSDALTITGEENDIAVVVSRIVNHGVSDVSTDIVKGTAATGSSNAPNGPNCNPGTSGKYLWITHYAADDDDNTALWWPVEGAPVAQIKSATGSSSCMTGVAYRWLEASSYNPSAFALSASEEWRAQTFAIPPAGGAGPVTGSFAVTESGVDTAAFAGDVLIDGSLAATESGGDTAALAGDVLISGTFAATESGADVAAIQGTAQQVSTGSLAATESGADTASIAGTVLVEGALAATESGSDTAAIAGDVPVSGTLAATESGADTAALAGDVYISGALAATESGSDTASTAGVVLVSGSLAATEAANDSAAMSGVVLISGTLDATESGQDTAAISSAPPVTTAYPGPAGKSRGKRRRVVIRERVYEVSERDIPALLEAELLDRAPPTTAEVIEGPKPRRKRARKAPQPVKTVEQVRETVQQIKARIEPDDAWLAQALEAVAFRVLERLQDEEDSLMLLLAA